MSGLRSSVNLCCKQESAPLTQKHTALRIRWPGAGWKSRSGFRTWRLGARAYPQTWVSINACKGFLFVLFFLRDVLDLNLKDEFTPKQSSSSSFIINSSLSDHQAGGKFLVRIVLLFFSLLVFYVIVDPVFFSVSHHISILYLFIVQTTANSTILILSLLLYFRAFVVAMRGPDQRIRSSTFGGSVSGPRTLRHAEKGN